MTEAHFEPNVTKSAIKIRKKTPSVILDEIMATTMATNLYIHESTKWRRYIDYFLYFTLKQVLNTKYLYNSTSNLLFKAPKLRNASQN